MLKMARYQQAVHNYSYALKSLAWSKKYSSSESSYDQKAYTHAEKGTLFFDPYKEVKLVEKRIKQKLKEAKRLLDIDKYGIGFVIYKEAETFRKQKNPDYISAILKYEELIFPTRTLKPGEGF